MLTKEENELLTRTGPGTPGGELLRRYWQPACFASALTEQKPTRRVKIMHEELVFYRDKEGQYGSIGEHCPHRGASLAYGFVEDCGIRCAYHGWKFGRDGRCLEQPFEPVGSTYKERVQPTAYPVEELAGILFVYMGPQPAPLLPRWDLLVWEDGQRLLMTQEDLHCNWLQIQENSADVTHTYFLHAHQLRLMGDRTRGVERLYRPFKRYGFQPFEWGLLKSWEYDQADTSFLNEIGAGNPLIFPNVLRDVEYPMHAMHWRVPIDDEWTRVLWAGFTPGVEVTPEARANPPVEAHPTQLLPNGDYDTTTFWGQDRMAWETQGAIMNRVNEHLGASDRGIVLYRQMLREQIERVQRGAEPMGLVRDPEKNRIIELPAWIVQEQRQEAFKANVGMQKVGGRMEDYFDARQEWFDVDAATLVHVS